MATPKLKKLDRVRSDASEYRPGRTVKMAAPQCSVCQLGNGQDQRGWWDKCEHSPYVESTEVSEDIPEIVTEEGVKIVKSRKTRIRVNELYRLVQIPVGTRHDSGRSVEKARNEGRKFPEEIGLAPFCEYIDCWSQDLKVNSPVYGRYCSSIHARLAAANEIGIVIDVFDMKRRAEQLASINV